VALCGLVCGYKCFGETCRLHLQGDYQRPSGTYTCHLQDGTSPRTRKPPLYVLNMVLIMWELLCIMEVYNDAKLYYGYSGMGEVYNL
jgi:hypothetical protein